jgi:hypothetical protein
VRLHWYNHLTLVLGTLPAFERVCGMLLALSEHFAVKTADGLLIDLTLTHATLAAMVGVGRPFLTMTLEPARAARPHAQRAAPDLDTRSVRVESACVRGIDVEAAQDWKRRSRFIRPARRCVDTVATRKRSCVIQTRP